MPDDTTPLVEVSSIRHVDDTAAVASPEDLVQHRALYDTRPGGWGRDLWFYLCNEVRLAGATAGGSLWKSEWSGGGGGKMRVGRGLSRISFSLWRLHAAAGQLWRIVAMRVCCGSGGGPSLAGVQAT